MISSPLLEKTRRINKILQKTAVQHVDFTEVAEVALKVIIANVYLVDRQGNLLCSVDEFECELMISNVLKEGAFRNIIMSSFFAAGIR